jgi:hypothetical protein
MRLEDDKFRRSGKTEAMEGPALQIPRLQVTSRPSRKVYDGLRRTGEA